MEHALSRSIMKRILLNYKETEMTDQEFDLIKELQPIIKKYLILITDGDRLLCSTSNEAVVYCNDCMEMNMFTEEFKREIRENTIIQIPTFAELWNIIDWREVDSIYPGKETMQINGNGFIIESEEPYLALLKLLKHQIEEKHNQQ